MSIQNREKPILASLNQGEFEYSYDAKALLSKQKKL